MSNMRVSSPVGVSQSRLIPGEPVAQFELGSMRNFIYLILDWETRKAVIVDPQKDIDTPLKALEEEDFTLVACLLTHSHHDHVAGVGPLLERYPNLPIHVHEGDAFRLKKVPDSARLVRMRDNENILVGNVKVKTLHTPGHSAGEVCYLVDSQPPRLLTGDTLFIRDCGRTDLETGDNEAMFRSLQRIKALLPETIILPGHHYSPEYASTLEEELRSSPPLRCKSVDELRQLP